MIQTPVHERDNKPIDPEPQPVGGGIPDEDTASYNGFFASVAEARMGWGLFQLALQGVDRFLDKPLNRDRIFLPRFQ